MWFTTFYTCAVKKYSSKEVTLQQQQHIEQLQQQFIQSKMAHLATSNRVVQLARNERSTSLLRNFKAFRAHQVIQDPLFCIYQCITYISLKISRQTKVFLLIECPPDWKVCRMRGGSLLRPNCLRGCICVTKQ